MVPTLPHSTCLMSWSSGSRCLSSPERVTAAASSPPHQRALVALAYADAPNQPWLTDIIERATGEGKAYLCAVKVSSRAASWATPLTPG